MYFSLVALALSATAFAAPLTRRQLGDILDTTVTGTQDGIDNIGSQVEGIAGELVDTDNPESALSSVNDITLQNTQDIVDDDILKRRQVGDILDTTVQGTQDGIDNIGSQVEGIAGELVDTDNPESALSSVNDITLENTNEILGDLGLGGS